MIIALQICKSLLHKDSHNSFGEIVEIGGVHFVLIKEEQKPVVSL